MAQLGAGLFADVDEEICGVFGLKNGRHLGQLGTAREVACSPVQSDELVALVRHLYGVVSGNLREPKPSRENWRWKPQIRIHDANESPEVVLERAVALLATKKHLPEWCNQIPVASGLVDHKFDKRAAVDLAKIAEGRLDLYELKWESNNPVYAAFEILKYSLAYLLCRVNRERFGYANLSSMTVNALRLNVLAPGSYYEGFKLAWLQTGFRCGYPDSNTRKTRATCFWRFLPVPQTSGDRYLCEWSRCDSSLWSYTARSAKSSGSSSSDGQANASLPGARFYLMRIRIHRGTAEIGGNCIEVEAQG